MMPLLLGQFLALLVSPWSFMAGLLGFLAFVVSPLIPKLTNEFHIFARFYQWLGASMLGRAAIVVSEQGDLLLKQMRPDDIGTEKISFNSDTKEFEDPAHAKSYWAGIPFALADEVHGILFDPRHPALGDRKRKAEEDSQMVVKATKSERDMYDIQGWVRGVFSFPKITYELVNLNRIRHLVTGIERAEHPERIKEFYENSRDPYEDGTGASRFIMILLALIGPFAAMWLISSQMDNTGGGSTVGFNTLLLLSMSGFSIVQLLKDTNWKRVAVYIAVLAPLPALFIILALVVGPTLTGFLTLFFLAGFFFVPIMTQLLKASASATDMLADKFIKFGFFSYDEPVFEWTNRGYKVREFSKMKNVGENIYWHTFLGNRTGFTFKPGEESWDTEVADTSNIENKAIADGGPRTNLPSDYHRMPDDGRAVYGDFVPSRLRNSEYYIKVGTALSRFTYAATGQKSHQRLLQSKQEYGGGSGLEDKTIVYAMVGCGMFSTVLGVFIFFL